jgi:hypothetical protein
MSEQSADLVRVAGRCTVHDDLAWLYEDGSINCFYCAVVETGFGGCEWEPMPEVWVQAAIYAQQTEDSDDVLAACWPGCGWSGEVRLDAQGFWTCPLCGNRSPWTEHNDGSDG